MKRDNFFQSLTVSLLWSSTETLQCLPKERLDVIYFVTWSSTFVRDFVMSSKREIRFVSSHLTVIYFVTFVSDKHFCINYCYMYKTSCYPLWVSSKKFMTD